MNNPNEFLQETHSQLFISLSQIINDIYDGEKHSLNSCLSVINDPDPNNEGRIIALLDSVLFFTDIDGKKLDIISLYENKELTSQIKKESCANLRIELPLPVIPAEIELQFLKYMLTGRMSKFLIPTNIREKLLLLMEDITPPNLDEHYETLKPVNNNTADEKLIEILHNFWLALCKGKIVYYENLANNGTLYKGEVIPIRIEYDAAINHYGLIAWEENDKRAIKMNAANVKQITLLDKNVPADIKKLFYNYLKQNCCDFTLKIEKKNNAVERCFTLFASYDKEATYDEDTETYTLKINYYRFDYKMVLEYVLSLGSAATVIAPNKMRNDIIEKIKAAQNIYAK